MRTLGHAMARQGVRVWASLVGRKRDQVLVQGLLLVLARHLFFVHSTGASDVSRFSILL